METAWQLKKKGCRNSRAGAWEPHTKPGGFKGRGEGALPWLKRVKDETGMLVSTEVTIPGHVELCLKYDLDILWVGTCTVTNPFATQTLADSLQGMGVPVLVKSPVNPDLELWIGALERLSRTSVKRLGAIHRGLPSYEKAMYRNLPMWQIPIELRRCIPELPITYDPSHIGGRRGLIGPLDQQAMDLGLDGLIVESHCDPDDAWGGTKQQVTPDALDIILSMLVIRGEHTATEGLRSLHAQIDELGDELMALLSKRLRVCREVGQYEKEHSTTVLQSNRCKEILGKRGKQGERCGISAESVASVSGEVHQESVRQQLKIINS